MVGVIHKVRTLEVGVQLKAYWLAWEGGGGSVRHKFTYAINFFLQVCYKIETKSELFR